MELKGLQRAVESIGPRYIKELVTDRHRSIGAWLRSPQVAHIDHLFDIWHIAKCINILHQCFLLLVYCCVPYKFRTDYSFDNTQISNALSCITYEFKLFELEHL